MWRLKTVDELLGEGWHWTNRDTYLDPPVDARQKTFLSRKKILEAQYLPQEFIEHLFSTGEELAHKKLNGIGSSKWNITMFIEENPMPILCNCRWNKHPLFCRC